MAFGDSPDEDIAAWGLDRFGPPRDKGTETKCGEEDSTKVWGKWVWGNWRLEVSEHRWESCTIEFVVELSVYSTPNSSLFWFGAAPTCGEALSKAIESARRERDDIDNAALWAEKGP